VRYGNVMGSRGSVIPFFFEHRKKGFLPITDPEMTRFNITLSHGVELVLTALESMWGGEIFVPRIPSYRITDVAEAIAPGCEQRVVGIRPGEKLHEEMITFADSAQTVQLRDNFVILPGMHWWDADDYLEQTGAKRVSRGFSYQSGTNTEWLTVEQLRELIREHVDPAFEPRGPA